MSVCNVVSLLHLKGVRQQEGWECEQIGAKGCNSLSRFCQCIQKFILNGCGIF